MPCRADKVSKALGSTCRGLAQGLVKIVQVRMQIRRDLLGGKSFTFFTSRPTPASNCWKVPLTVGGPAADASKAARGSRENLSDIELPGQQLLVAASAQAPADQGSHEGCQRLISRFSLGSEYRIC